MGYLSSFYRTKIRPYRDSDDEVEIRWYKAADTAVPLPFYQRYATGVWDDRMVPWVGPGRVSMGQVWDKGLNVDGLLGRCFLGSAEQWRRGPSIHDPVPAELPPCCQPHADVLVLAIQPVSEVVAGPFWRVKACACASPASVASAVDGVAATVCACGTVSSSIYTTPSYRATVCACGDPESDIVTGPDWRATVCACATVRSYSHIVPPWLSDPCACGHVVSYDRTISPYASDPCACGTVSSSILIVPPYASDPCACGTVSSSILIVPPYASDACACGDPESDVVVPPPPIYLCSYCPNGAWEDYQTDLSGFGGSLAYVNGDHTLKHLTQCAWFLTPANFYSIILNRMGGSYWRLQIEISDLEAEAVYTSDVDTGDCLAGFVLNLVSVTGGTAPSTVLITH